MAKLNEQGDYFVPVLAPYVQWVQHYGQLISALYEEHKTVKRTWKAFRDKMPGVEQRLEFGVFEQILLFSLFLSEWNEGNEPGISIQEDHHIKQGIRDRQRSNVHTQPDAVIQKLRNLSDERDRALWNVKHLEENAVRLTARKEDLEKQVNILNKSLDKVQNELGVANANLNMAIHELDTYRAENACLREENSVLKDRETSFEEQVKRLVETPGWIAPDKAHPPQTVAVKRPEVKQGPSQAVIQWVGQGSAPQVKQEVIQYPGGEIPARKIAGWNVQLSKDGYYRVYRKIKGKVHSIYIGKELDIDKANRRIADKERELM